MDIDGSGTTREMDPVESSTRKRQQVERALEDAGDATNEKSALGKPKNLKKKHMDPKVLALRGFVQKCCASNDLSAAIMAYECAVSEGTRVEPQSFYNLLSLCDGVPERAIHVGTPKQSFTKQSTAVSSGKAEMESSRNECNDGLNPKNSSQIDISTRKEYALKIKNHMDELQIPLTENAFTALIKLFSKAGDFEKAEVLILQAESTQQCRPKLRMYSSLLQKYCEVGLMQKALKVWLRISNQSLALSEREYVALIKCATMTGSAAVMRRAISDLAEDVIVPSLETTRAIIHWFQSPHATCLDRSATTSKIESTLSELKDQYKQEVADMGSVQCENGWMITEAARVDEVTGVVQNGCMKGARLQPVATSDQAWEEMALSNEEIGKMALNRLQNTICTITGSLLMALSQFFAVK